MLKIGITGGIGSGKSTISTIFKHLQVPVFNADEAGRTILTENQLVIEKITQAFGKEVLTNNLPDRKLIGKVVFKNPEKLTALNAIIHPAVNNAFETWYNVQTAPYILKEAAILFETGSYKALDKNILIIAPEELRISRVLKRDQTTKSLVLDRIKNQWHDDKKIPLADFIVNNNDEELVTPQVLAIHNKILALQN